ncbi:hypothetical protein C8F04DRAFT_389978 [Mycena alexandri]|uniref:Uncharacterized protein n=1 Tax=Mycena alexandri TaxID=1745969 RepID=A0AAD6T2E2_9AGAR|nr:hypothetical protein C8F04DRAFT_389978 [Mycena alexandri]
MPGTAAASLAPIFTGGTASTLFMANEGDKPWLGLVLYSHVRPESTMPLYHNAAKVTGEVRVALESPINIGSIDVWVVITADSSLDTFKPPLKSMTVNLWNRKKGDPRSPAGGPFKGKFPAGTFVFPFELPELPQDTLVKHPDDTKHRNQARVPFPPTYFVSKTMSFWGKVKYTAGVNVVRDWPWRPRRRVRHGDASTSRSPSRCLVLRHRSLTSPRARTGPSIERSSVDGP